MREHQPKWTQRPECATTILDSPGDPTIAGRAWHDAWGGWYAWRNPVWAAYMDQWRAADDGRCCRPLEPGSGGLFRRQAMYPSCLACAAAN